MSILPTRAGFSSFLLGGPQQLQQASGGYMPFGTRQPQNFNQLFGGVGNGLGGQQVGSMARPVTTGISAPLTGSNGGAYAANILRVSQAVANGGWRFTGTALAQIVGPTQNWQQASSGGMNYMAIRPGARPSDAINELFSNARAFHFDCATSTAVVLQKARLETIGAFAFDSLYSRQPLILAGWTDTSGTNLSMSRSARMAGPGQYSFAGRSTIPGDLAPFNAALGDKLVPGSVYYFERPGDTSTFNQGWNSIYLGKQGNQYMFWRVQDGIHGVTLANANGLLIDLGGMYNQEYLSSSILTPSLGNRMTQAARSYLS